MGGIARGGAQGPAFIFGKRNVDFQASRAQETPLNTNTLIPDSGEYGDSGSEMVFTADDIESSIESVGARETAQRINDSIVDGEPVLVGSANGTIPVVEATVQSVGKRGDILLYHVDPSCTVDGVEYARTIQSAMQQRFDDDFIGKQVTVLEADDIIENMETFIVSYDGAAGGGVRRDTRELCGLYSLKTSKKGSGSAIFQEQRDCGGDNLQCFDTYLPGYYQRFGAREVARVPFNREYAPQGWDYDAFETQFGNSDPDIVLMTIGDGLDSPDSRTFEDLGDAEDYVQSLRK